METIVIENAAIRVGVQPGYGARVTSLVDKASGRDWIFPGEPSPNTGEDAVYSINEAIGWDECFPTVSVYDATRTPWARRLRDHGDLWGREWRVDGIRPDAIVTSYADPLFTFTRALRVEGPALMADYEVTNRGRNGLPFLWALHALFAVTPEDRIVMSEARRVTATHLSIDGQNCPTPFDIDWPGPGGELPLALDGVLPASRHLSAKLLATGIPSRSVAVGHGREWLNIGWDAALDNLGIWLNYGAWPSPGTLHHIALEPTSDMADHLGQVIARDTPNIAPNGKVSWQVTMRIGSEAPAGAA